MSLISEIPSFVRCQLCMGKIYEGEEYYELKLINPLRPERNEIMSPLCDKECALKAVLKI